MGNILPSFPASPVGGPLAGSQYADPGGFLSKLTCRLVLCLEDRGPLGRDDPGPFLPAAGSHTQVLRPGEQF